MSTALYQVPLGFSRVESNIYRSAYPSRKTFPFLSTLNLKSMICLNPFDLRLDLKEYLDSKSISLFAVDIRINQEPFLVISESLVREIIQFALDIKNQPTLIFCTNGKVRSSCAVACLRKSLGWSLTSIFQEFEQFAEPEGGIADLLFIENFNAVESI